MNSEIFKCLLIIAGFYRQHIWREDILIVKTIIRGLMCWPSIGRVIIADRRIETNTHSVQPIYYCRQGKNAFYLINFQNKFWKNIITPNKWPQNRMIFYARWQYGNYYLLFISQLSRRVYSGYIQNSESGDTIMGLKCKISPTCLIRRKEAKLISCVCQIYDHNLGLYGGKTSGRLNL